MLRELGAVEIGGRLESAVEFYAFASTNVLEIGEVEAGAVTLEEGVAEGDLALDKLCVAAEGEGLPVSVLLLAGHAGGRTGGALWVFRVALG